MNETTKNLITGALKFMGVDMKQLIGEVDEGSYVPMDFAAGGSSISPATLIENDKNWVAVCVDKIAETMSGIPLQLKRYDADGEDEEIFDHPIIDLLDKPNGVMTGRDLIYFLIAHEEIVGQAFLLQDKENDPTQIFPLPPANVKVILNKENTEVTGYKYSIGTFTREYKPEEIVFLKYPNTANPLKGKSKLEKIAEWVDVDNYATDFNRRFFLNGATLSGNLETEYTTKEGLELAKLGFEMRHKGAANAHKVGVLPKGTKFVPSNLPPKDMQFVEMDTKFRDKVLSAYGVPKSVLGIVEDVNRSNAEASNYVFMAFTIKPKMERLVAYFNEFLLPRFKNTEDLYIDFPDIVPDNEELTIRKYQAALGNAAYMTVNEVRGQLGLGQVEGGDEIPQPGGFMLGIDGKPQGVETRFLKKKDVKVSATKRPWYVKRKVAKKVHDKQKMNKVKDSLVDGAIAAIAKILNDPDEIEHRKFIVRVSQYEKKFREKTKAHDERLRKEAISRLPSARGFTKAIGDELVDKDSAVRAMIDFATPLLGELVASEGKAQMERLPTEIVFDPKDPKAAKRIKELMDLSAENYTDTTIQLLTKKLKAEIEAGSSMDQLTKVVNDVFDFTEKYRAARIARSVVFGAANTAAREAYKQSGVVQTVKWHTAEDELVCEFCGPLNGKIIDVDENFFEKGDTINGRDGGTLDLDFMDVEDPPLHANCRCFTTADKIQV